MTRGGWKGKLEDKEELGDPGDRGNPSLVPSRTFLERVPSGYPTIHSLTGVSTLFPRVLRLISV